MLICMFVSAHTKFRFSHDAAQFIFSVFHVCETVLCSYVDIMHKKNSLSGREQIRLRRL